MFICKYDVCTQLSIPYKSYIGATFSLQSDTEAAHCLRLLSVNLDWSLKKVSLNTLQAAVEVIEGSWLRLAVSFTSSCRPKWFGVNYFQTPTRCIFLFTTKHLNAVKYNAVLGLGTIQMEYVTIINFVFKGQQNFVNKKNMGEIQRSVGHPRVVYWINIGQLAKQLAWLTVFTNIFCTKNSTKYFFNMRLIIKSDKIGWEQNVARLQKNVFKV